MLQIAGFPKFVCPQTVHGERPRRCKMPFDAGIEATGATVIETHPIPKNKHDGEHKHPSRGRNRAPFHQFPAAIPAVVAGLSYAGGAVATAAEGTGLVALAAGATTEWAAAGAAFLCGPPGWIILGLREIAAVGVAVWRFTDSTATLSPVVICPCTKFGRPWVGGIEGWSINDLVGVVNNKAMQFVADEIFPLIDAWKAFHGYPAQIPPTPQPSWSLTFP